MELEKTEKKDYQLVEEMEQNKSTEEKLHEELKYEKRHQDWTYKLMKFNPIDPLNDLYRYIVKRLDIKQIEGRLQWWGAFIYIKWAARTFWNFKAEYPKGNMFPEWGPGILVGNHESHLDPFFYGAACHRRIRYMSKLDNFKTPIVKTLFNNLGAFKVDRENPERGWEKAKEILRGGEWVGIFPEGTRSRDGDLGEFKTGAVRLAVEMQVPIVPMAVINSRNALKKGNLVMKPTQVKVRVGDPIFYNDYDINSVSYNDIKRLNDDLRNTIWELREGIYGKEEDKELSIGSPEEASREPKFNIMRYLKDQAKGVVGLIDDTWYAILRSLEEFNAREIIQRPIHAFSGELVCNLSDLMMPYRVIDFGKHIPAEGPVLICPSHNSEWDVLILAASIIHHPPRRVAYQMAKQSLFKIPLVNAWVRNHHAFPLKRGMHDVDSFLYAKELLEQGKLVITYPEGTTNTGDGQLLEGHTGPMRLAIETKTPIIPIGITGTEKVYPKRAKMLEFYKGCILKAGAPFTEHQQHWDKRMPDYDELKRLTNSMMAQIKDLLLYDTPDA
ncbi:MAG: 1-acyl-sn-glycerol-3-phosphate acyltransferase [Candidatus Lokiarchaeota archaeon]|nr:1-acyl-sn-glycerol-3-phosphate acyltransferase [Candidatus Lokiarchaeota archaeon]